MSKPRLLFACFIAAALSGCGGPDHDKVAALTAACLDAVARQNGDVQIVKLVEVGKFGADIAGAADKSGGVDKVLPFDAKYSIMMRSDGGKWEDGLALHLKLMMRSDGRMDIVKLAQPDDADYTAQSQRLEPWQCSGPSS